MTQYDAAFYEQQSAASVRSARSVLPVIFQALGVRSVVDVGCGVGSWLKVCKELGATDVLGLDGNYVDRSRLLIPKESFRPTDLTSHWSVERRFDLAICMEVAEHLDPSVAPAFVKRITATADAVLFSAAIPYQGGTGHVHENWQEYWAEVFRESGYDLYDLVRPKFWNDSSVEYWYRQNAFVFARQGSDAAARLKQAAGPAMPLSLVHPEAYLYAVARGTILSRQRVDEDIQQWRDLTGGNAAARTKGHDLNSFPWLALRSAIKKIVKAPFAKASR